VEELSVGRLKVVPMGRAGAPEETAGVIWFLLSDAAAYITGEVVNVDGGMRMHTPLYSNFVA